MNIREEWPLITFTILFPSSVATYLFALILPSALSILRPAFTAIAWALAIIALFLVSFHLGRPLRAPRVVAHMSQSWLSRESGLAGLYTGLLFLHAFKPTSQLGLIATSTFAALTLAAGLGSLYASARAYNMPARPGWRFGRTLAQFAGDGISLALLVSLMFFSIVIGQGAHPFPQATFWLRWGALIPGIWILVRWLSAYREAAAFAAGKGHLPGHPSPEEIWRHYKIATALAGLALTSLGVAVLLTPDTFLFLLALLAEAGAIWFYRVSFFTRAQQISVRGLVEAERRSRLKLAANVPVSAGSYPSQGLNPDGDR